MIDSKKIGNFIAKEREKKGFTQEQLANKLFVTRQAVSKWERGLGIPDYELLARICEVLNVTPNEVIAGERKEKDNSSYVDNITIDILKNHTKKIKRMIIFSISIILLLIILFLIYYFVSTYNQFKIYKISGSNGEFQMLDTLAVFSNENAYIKFGGVQSFSHEIENVEFYYIKNNEKMPIYSSENGEALLIQNKGYNEYFDFSDVDEIIDTMTLDVMYKENYEQKIVTIDLDIERVYANSNLMFDDTEKISNNSPNELTNFEQINLDKIKNLFTLSENNEYVLSFMDKNNKKIKLVYNLDINSFIVSETYNNIIEEFWFWSNNNFEYRISKDGNELSASSLNNGNIICNNGECNLHEEKYNYFKKQYIDTYLN